MPEARFSDIMVIENPARLRVLEIEVDATFMGVVIPGSIVVVGVVPDLPMTCGAAVRNGTLCLRFGCDDGAGPLCTVVTLSGLRKDRSGIRFPHFTQEQARRNRRFWSRAYQ
jgi:hypothetical protein